ncbi:MAG: DUF3261 domain-containing protein [Myxococcota bacterium]
MMRHLAIVAILLFASCHRGNRADAPPSSGPPLDESAYPGELRAVDALPGDFLWRQHVTAHWPLGSRGFDAALQKRDDKLTLLGLTPMGTPAFTLVLTDDALTFENRSDRELPFPPRFVVLDLQRVFYPWLPGPPPADGERSGEVEGERVHERYAAGRLVERGFTRLDATPPGTIRVTYRDYEPGAQAPRHAELDNGWFGYRIVVETSAQQALAE